MALKADAVLIWFLLLVMQVVVWLGLKRKKDLVE